MAVPALEPWVLFIASVILVILFTNQHRGTSILGRLFGPIMVLWFVVLAVLGAGQIMQEPAVLAAINPLYGAIPPALLMNLRHYDVLHETVFLVSVQVSKRPRVPAARRATVHDLGEGFFQVVLLFGFIDEPDVPTALKNIVHYTFGFDPNDATYFVGRESILVTELVSMAKWREHLFAFLHRNAASAARFFDLPSERVVEVGVQVPI